MIGDRLLYTLVPVIIGILIVLLLTPSSKTGSKSNSKISLSNRFGSGEFFDPIADIYDITNRIMVSNQNISAKFLMIRDFAPFINQIYF